MRMVTNGGNPFYTGHPNHMVEQPYVHNLYPSQIMPAAFPPYQQQLGGGMPFQPYPQPPGTVPWQPPPMGAGEQEDHFLFKNPLETAGGHPQGYPPWQAGMPQMPMNPYPKNFLQPKQKSGMNSVINSFKSQDGTIDINKMVNTAGQAINAVSQASALLKGLGGVFKA
ncbi:hypothetical protein D1B31_10175 [Neobacillus notoginsengisoli]|uniref:Spore coat protein n=1 Tax=Neobacillus notoginsengisoli TaxID=1578198 RepID=A0A417YVM7_9BACI|nr:YppG family protein [Neobacillus notoginsengisoli]RHW41288.1 hypothetical protein D1B31_10175 [Neobacillus notoginsengisoli]